MQINYTAVKYSAVHTDAVTDFTHKIVYRIRLYIEFRLRFVL